MLQSEQKTLPSCLWKGKYRLKAGVEWNVSVGLGGEEQIYVPTAPHTWAGAGWCCCCRAPALCPVKGGWCFKGHWRRELWLVLKSFVSAV